MMADGELLPVPNPTDATQAAIERAAAAERDYVNGQIGILVQRLDAIDRATELLSDTVNRVPTVVQTEISHIRSLMEEKFGSEDSLMEEKFRSVETQFRERDTRTEREARDNKLAVDAAFAAQEKQAVAQNESNALAISKSEAATTETIRANQQLSSSKTDSLTKDVDNLKLAVSRLETSQATLSSSRVDQRLDTGQILQVMSVIIAVAAVVFAIVHG